jgi:hypothetical protein
LTLVVGHRSADLLNEDRTRDFHRHTGQHSPRRVPNGARDRGIAASLS